jgi:hypothetical protein
LPGGVTIFTGTMWWGVAASVAPDAVVIETSGPSYTPS